MQIYVFTDLDDTLFQTLRKCPTPREELCVGSISRAGEPLSFLTKRQQTLFQLLDAQTCMIPTTARNEDAFRRVRPSFQHGAILNYGGTILTPDGTLDRQWHTVMQSRLRQSRSLVLEALEQIRVIIAQEKLTSVPRLIETAEDHLPLYVVVKNPDGRVEDLEVIHKRLASVLEFESVGRIHRNDNNLAFIPNSLNKSYAVRYVIDAWIKPSGEDYLTIGMGDSLEDLAFMNECDYSVVPSTSQIRHCRLRG